MSFLWGSKTGNIKPNDVCIFLPLQHKLTILDLPVFSPSPLHFSQKRQWYMKSLGYYQCLHRGFQLSQLAEPLPSS